MSTIGSRLKKRREELDLEQKDAAKALGISNVVLNRYEKDKRKPDLETIAKIAIFYSVSTDWIINGNKLPVPNDPKYSDIAEYTMEEEFARKGLSPEAQREALEYALRIVEEARKKYNKHVK